MSAVPMTLKSAEAHISAPSLMMKFTGGDERISAYSSYSTYITWLSCMWKYPDLSPNTRSKLTELIDAVPGPISSCACKGVKNLIFTVILLFVILCTVKVPNLEKSADPDQNLLKKQSDQGLYYHNDPKFSDR